VSSQGNRLCGEKSPYLRQHADNPVNWFPWGKGAFDAAINEKKLVFLSIGYSTCHWCHVMAHESFEDDEVAALLNRDYISIKVDREERPDIDQVYMDVCVRLTGSGGWPLTAILTPEGLPVFAGTYFGKQSRFGRPGLVDLLPVLAERWQLEPDQFIEVGQEVAQRVGESGRDGDSVEVTPSLLEIAASQLVASYDKEHGGFGPAPKFPRPHDLSFLLRRWRRGGDVAMFEAVEGTLEAMRSGGIYDQVGGGFHRYSTDREWFVPHFEKMLYDQAGLAVAYLEGYQVTGRQLFADTVQETLDYVLRDLRAPQGAFFCAEDADSEGAEGSFYLWSEGELQSVLGAELASTAMKLYGANPGGNLEGEMAAAKKGGNLLHLPGGIGSEAEEQTEHRQRINSQLLAARSRRTRPHRDEKILTAWNGMMISALARAGAGLARPDYVDAAVEASRFLLDNLSDGQGRLLRRWADSEAAIGGFAEDYAFFAKGLLDLHQATLDISWLQHALRLADALHLRFTSDSGALFDTASDGETLLFRPRSIFDGAHLSATSAGLDLYARLFLLTADPVWEKRAQALLRAVSVEICRAPAHFSGLLQGGALLIEPTREVVVAGTRHSSETSRLLDVIQRSFLPETTLLLVEPEHGDDLCRLAPHVKDMLSREGGPVAYLCQGFSCQQPVYDPKMLYEMVRNAP